MGRSRGRGAWVVAVVAVLLVAACTADDGGSEGAGASEAPEPTLHLEAVSTRPELVTAGDVLVAVDAPEGIAAEGVAFTVDGAAVDVDAEVDEGGRILALVGGLPEGSATIEARAGDETASLDVVNHPTTGPVFSGPHLPLPVCTTEQHGLGPALDEDCSAETRTTWRYVDDAGEWRSVETLEQVPDGVTPVRREQGTINRAAYWIDVPEEGWNGRLVYEFGGGCGTTYSQGFRLMGESPIDVYDAGYATATSTFNTFQVMCNDVLSAETMMMVKEHFAETVGVPELTIGQGGSGGAIQQYLIVQNYPGLLDAVGALLPFPDALSIAPDVVDCGLLERFFASDAAAEWTGEEKRAVTGFLNASTCTFWNQTFVPALDPTTGCSLPLLSAAADLIDGVTRDMPGLDESELYDPETNPDGLRCTLPDTNVNVLGVDPETGFANRPLDNVGVQYGLAALNDGSITFEQFVELNRRIGSFDLDGRPTSDRAVATEDTLEQVYSSGRVIDGSGDLRNIPIITVDIWTDDQGDIHDRSRAFTVRERLRGEDGSDPPNHMIWTRGLPGGDSLIDSLTGSLDLGLDLIDVLDEWATAIAADTSGDPLSEIIERSRPDAAVDNCLTADGDRVSGLDLYDGPGPCTDPYPVSSTPRRVAGAPLVNDIGKCRLQTVVEAESASVYEIDLDDARRTALEEVFPEGVCDWTRPGVGQVPVEGTWLDFSG